MKIFKGIAVTLTAALLISGGGVATSLVTAQPAQAASTQSEIDVAINQILNETNAERAKVGLTPLKLNSSISAIAQSWSQSMATQKSMVHNPDYQFQMPKPWMRVGENVGQGYTSSTIVAAWMASPGHKANILGDFTHIGLGYWVDDTGRGWFTQNFGKYDVPVLTEINEPVTTVGKFDITATWDRKWEENVRDYKAELYSLDGTLLQSKIVPVSNSTVTFGGLTDFTTYSVKIVAQSTNTLGEQFVSPVKTVTVTTVEDLPTVTIPANLTLVPGENTLAASWDAPMDLNGTLQPYKVELYKSGALVDTMETVVASHTFTNLTTNTGYTVKVIAKTSVRTKTATATAESSSKTLLSSVAAVTEPTNVTPIPSSTTIKTTWDAPVSQTGQNLKYVLTLSTAGKADVVVETTSPAYTFTNLSNITPYSVKVQANITAENGVNTTTTAGVVANVSTLADFNAVKVDAPALLPVKINPRSAELSWSNPTLTAGKIVDYTITVKQQGQPNRVFTSTQNSYTITELAENTAYSFEVKVNAVSLNNENSVSATSAPVTKTTPYAADTVIVSTPQLLSLNIGDTGAISASWSAPATVVGDLTGYKVTLRTGTTVVKTLVVTGRSADFTGPIAGVTYTVEVSALATSPDNTKNAVSSALTGAVTVPAAVKAPNAPTVFKADPAYNDAKLSWVAPTGVVGNLTDYTVTVKQAGKADRTFKVTGTSYTVSGLVENTSYTVTVVANVLSSDGVKAVISPSASTAMQTFARFIDSKYSSFPREVDWMKTAGISTGYADGSYDPFGTVTREQMAAFMYRMAGRPSFTATVPFTDAKYSSFPTEVNWMKTAGISTGYWDGTYDPFSTVNREQMAAFMYRYATKVCSVNAPASKYFVDTKYSSFPAEVSWMGGAGISTGYWDGTYRPYDPVTREQMAAFMYRLNNYIESNGGCKRQ